MKSFWKNFLFICLILILISVYNDLQVGQSLEHPPSQKDPFIMREMKDVPDRETSFEIVRMKVQRGDTVLSIVEEINPFLHDGLNIEVILNDFQRINPFVDPYNLKPGKYYSFPIYTYDS